MKHKWLKNFDEHGNWTKPTRELRIQNSDGEIEIHDLDKYAKQHGIELPDAKKSKKKINKDIEEKHGDMESSQHSGDTEEHGDGNSESTE